MAVGPGHAWESVTDPKNLDRPCSPDRWQQRRQYGLLRRSSQSSRQSA